MHQPIEGTQKLTMKEWLSKEAERTGKTVRAVYVYMTRHKWPGVRKEGNRQHSTYIWE